MKWSVVGLLFLGVVAAIAAVVLVVGIEARRAPAIPSAQAAAAPVDEEEVEVLVAARDLGARRVVESGDVAVRSVPISAAPEGAFRDPVLAVGRVLTLAMKEGQAFLPFHFARPGSGLHVASALEPGMRAVSITLSDVMGIEELLDPGSKVDVLAHLEADLEDGFGEKPLTATLLSDVTVLAVGRRTVVGGDDEERSGQRRPPVTLLLDPQQAELLKLAMQEGSVSLVLRGPMDAASAPPEGTSLAELSPLLADARARALARQRRMEQAEAQRAKEQREVHELELKKIFEEAELARQKRELALLETERARAAEETPRWEAIVLRGGTAEMRTFDSPAAEPLGAEALADSSPSPAVGTPARTAGQGASNGEDN